MEFRHLEHEFVVELPERLETDTNTSFVGLGQGNLGIQIGLLSGQGMLQANAASIHVTQVNF